MKKIKFKSQSANQNLVIFLISAGERLIVILVFGNLYHEFLIAARTLSFDSWTAVSHSHTIAKADIQFAIKVSTSIKLQFNQIALTDFIFDNIKKFLLNY